VTNPVFVKNTVDGSHCYQYWIKVASKNRMFKDWSILALWRHFGKSFDETLYSKFSSVVGHPRGCGEILIHDSLVG
jgi:hypothetical protein